MKTTKKSLAADKRRLQEQLASAAGQTRKTLHARVHEAEQKAKELTKEVQELKDKITSDDASFSARLNSLQNRVKELETEIKA